MSLLKKKIKLNFTCLLWYSLLGLDHTYFRIRQKQKEGGTYSPRDAEIIDTKFKLDQLITVADLELKDERLTRWAHPSGRSVVQNAWSHDPILTYACWKCLWALIYTGHRDLLSKGDLHLLHTSRWCSENHLILILSVQYEPLTTMFNQSSLFWDK